jgi:signal transduction histidine kinase
MQKLLKEKSREFFETDLNHFIESRAKVIFHDFTQKNRDFNGELLIELENQSLKTRILPPEFGDVLSNIIDNALYTLSEKSKVNKSFLPQIKLTTKLINGEVQLRIKDNGKGIPQRDLNLIFSPFFTTKPTSKGTGLGLFMTKDIIELHKGKIELNSKEGEFTEVIITLPTLN